MSVRQPFPTSSSGGAAGNLTGAVTSIGLATSLGSFTSAQLATALTDETGDGANVFANSPTFTGTPILPTPFTIGAISMTATGTQLNFLSAAAGTTGTASTNVVFSTSPTLTSPTVNTSLTTSISAATGGPIWTLSQTMSSGTAGTAAIALQSTCTRSSNTGGNAGTCTAVKGIGQYSGTGTQVDAYGVYGIVNKITSASGSITDAYSIYGDLPVASGGGTITRSWALYGNGNLGLVGTCAKYNAITTVSNGVPAEYANSDLTAQTAAIAATTLYAVPASGAGMYRVSWVATITTAASISSVLGGTSGFQLKYTNNSDSVVKTTVAGNSVTSAANTTATSISGVEIAYCKASTNLQYLFDYTSSGTAMAFDLSIKVEAL